MPLEVGGALGEPYRVGSTGARIRSRPEPVPHKRSTAGHDEEHPVGTGELDGTVDEMRARRLQAAPMSSESWIRASTRTNRQSPASTERGAVQFGPVTNGSECRPAQGVLASCADFQGWRDTTTSLRAVTRPETGPGGWLAGVFTGLVVLAREPHRRSAP